MERKEPGNMEWGLADIVGEIFSIRESNIAASIAVAVILISGGLNLYGWTQTEYDLAKEAATDDQWLIEFNISVSTMIQEETWQDEEKKVIEFYMDEFVFPEGYLIGSVKVIVKPDSDSNGTTLDPIAQCDSIGANIRNDGGLAAQWDFEGNILSGQDSSCEWIIMSLQTYPGYDGDDVNFSAANQFQALLPWSESGWGEGVLSVEVELDVNTVEELGPITQDDDEDITIEVEVSGFIASAMLIN
ncbi:MAG: hypothetical protein ACJZ42_02755 [Candidatus Thalassarchaeaceae archaeon]|nr:MAG: hypothetical protein CND84_05130 [Marine Group II euryarchaeote MED-G35]